MLGVPLDLDFAWGWARGAGGGNKSASTIKQSFDECPYVQAGSQQIHNYTSTPRFTKEIAETLHFYWLGNLDIIFPKFQYPDNTKWANEMSTMIVSQVGALIKEGAPYVMVPSLYNKQISPAHTFMASKPAQQTDMGKAIVQSNGIIKAALEKEFGDKVIWYDAYTRMMDIWNNHASYGITKVGTNFCDGDTAHPNNFQECIYDGKGYLFYWVNYTDPTTRVHQLIAQDMYAMLKKRFS